MGISGISFSFAQCMLYPVTLQDRIQLSGAIVEGRVISQAAFWNSTGTLLYTASTVEVYKDFMGNVNAQQIQVITEGGTGKAVHLVEPGMSWSRALI